jgi:hypothetical protein
MLRFSAFLMKLNGEDSKLVTGEAMPSTWKSGCLPPKALSGVVNIWFFPLEILSALLPPQNRALAVQSRINNRPLTDMVSRLTC